MDRSEEPALEDVIQRICDLTDGIRDFWSTSHGWAPEDAAELLSQARLDRQVSLSHCLMLWTDLEDNQQQNDGRLILAWANLGALVEGAMKWFLCVYRDDYPEDEGAYKRRGKLLEPGELKLDQLRQFFYTYVWVESERAHWDAWLVRIRDRRNALHSYRDRDIADWPSWGDEVREYLDFIEVLDGRVPYPDDPYQSY